MAATMIYNEVKLMCITSTQHLFNTETIHPCPVRSRRHVLREAGKPIYIYRESVDQLTGPAGSSS